MDKQVGSISKSCFHWIRNIGCISNYITDDACKTLVQSLITSQLDYGNAILYCLPTNLINKLQRYENTSAVLISRTKKHDDTLFSPLAARTLLVSMMTLTLSSYHWLPDHYLCQYKILMLVLNHFMTVHPSIKKN